VISALPQKPRPAVVAIIDFMRKNQLALSELIQVGGQDFRSASDKRVQKAHRVEKCWSLMARLSVRFADLEQALGNLSTRPSTRTRRGEGHFPEAVEITGVSDTFAHHTKPNEINDLADSAPVGDPQLNPGLTE